MQNPEKSIGFLINDVTRLMRRNLNRRAQDLGLPQAQWRALAFLSRKQGVKQITLADSLEVQPITLARMIDRLEEAGLVTRRPDPDDRRAVRLYLTAEAQPLLDQMWERAAKTQDDAMADLSVAERENLIKSLQRIKQSLLITEGCRADADYDLEEKGLANAAKSS